MSSKEYAQLNGKIKPGLHSAFKIRVIKDGIKKEEAIEAMVKLYNKHGIGYFRDKL